MTIKQLTSRILALPFVMAGSFIFAIIQCIEFSFMFLKNGGEITAIYNNKSKQQKEREDFVNQIADAVVNKLQKP